MSAVAKRVKVPAVESATIKAQTVAIKAPNLKEAMFTIVGIAPYVQNAFGAKAREQMRSGQAEGSPQGRKKGGVRTPKDFDQCYEESKHIAAEGWNGVPAPAFRAAFIDTCRLVGFHMTMAKMSVFVHADGFDKNDGTPLVKITKGKPRKVEHCVRLPNGNPDIRARAMWDEGWELVLRVQFDADQFTLSDVTNLVSRAGQQVGVGEGRPFSKKSAGMGWGMFKVKGPAK